MNILFDHQIYSLQRYGGISRYIYELSRHIAGMGKHKVEIFAPLYLNEYHSAARNDCVNGVKIGNLSGAGRYIAWGFDTALAWCQVRPRRDVDIFQETYFSTVDCRPCSAKRVITVYDMIHEKFPGSFPKGKKMRQIKAYAVRRADHVICISENTRRDLIELLGIPEQRTSVVYLGSSLTAREAQKKPDFIDTPYILFVGQRGGYKNFATLLRAYASSRELQKRFIVVCFGGGPFLDVEHEMLAGLGLTTAKVRQIAGGDDVLAGLYGAAAAFVYPSLYEGFGIPPLEAMAYGCPVVCSNSSSLPEVVGEAAVLFNPADEAEMAAAIERVVFSPELIQIMVNRGRARIKKFSWEECARQTVKVYEMVLQG